MTTRRPTPAYTPPDPALLAALSRPGQPLAKVHAADPVIAGRLEPPAPAVRGGGELSKLTIRIDATVIGRARAAYLATGPARGIASLSAWLAEVIEQAVEQVETQHNGGHQFEPLGVDVVPKGRMSGL